MISGGQGAGNLVRIGHMGPVGPLAAPGRRPGRRRADARRSRRPGRDRRRRRGRPGRALAGETGHRVTDCGRAPAPGYADVTIERDVECRLSVTATPLRADVYRPADESDASRPADADAVRQDDGRRQLGLRAPRLVREPRVRRRHPGRARPTRLRRRVHARSSHESDDGYDSVEWAAGLRGSNGKVGMYGFSYPGATQLLAAVSQPPSLAAIAPGFTSSQFYDGWTYSGGAFSLASMRPGRASSRSIRARRRGDEEAHAALLGALGAAPSLFWQLPLRDYLPLLQTPRTVLPRLARALELRRLLARDSDRRGLLAHHRARPPHRRLVRHLPRRHGRELPRHRPGAAEAADGAVAALAVAGDQGGAARGRRRERGRRLAPPLLRRGVEGRGERRLRRTGPRLVMRRGLAGRRTTGRPRARPRPRTTSTPTGARTPPTATGACRPTHRRPSRPTSTCTTR